MLQLFVIIIEMYLGGLELLIISFYLQIIKLLMIFMINLSIIVYIIEQHYILAKCLERL